MARTFSYRARDFKGQLVTGFLEAESEVAVIRRLQGKNLFVTDIRPATKKSAALTAFLGGRVSQRDLAVFCRQFSVMLDAGLPVFQALSVLAGQAENKVLRGALEGVIDRLEGGLSLAEAFRLYPRVFPAVFTSMVEAGEVSGTLEEVLERLAVHFEKEHEIREAVRGALTYPTIVLIVAALVIGILLTFVVPTFVNIFRDMNLPMPLPTRFLMGLSLFCKRFWPLLLFGLVLTGAALRYFFTYTPQGKEVWDRFVLRVPVLGTLVRKVIVARFARTLGTMVQSGVPILAALEVVKRTIGNVVITRALEQTIENVSEGGAIAGLLEKTGVFPPMVTRMVAVGEETGALEELLEKVAVFYDQDVEATAKRLSVAIEPLLIVVLGFIVGSIILSVLVPIFSIYGSVR